MRSSSGCNETSKMKQKGFNRLQTMFYIGINAIRDRHSENVIMNTIEEAYHLGDMLLIL